MRPIEISLVAVSDSQAIPLDQYISPFNVSIFGRIDSGAPTFTVQYTGDDIWNTPAANISWTDHPNLTSKTANSDSNLAAPASAVRLRFTAGAGKVTMIVRQAGIGGA